MGRYKNLDVVIVDYNEHMREKLSCLELCSFAENTDLLLELKVVNFGTMYQ